MPQPFHLAIPVHSLSAARGFYGELFGCPEGRSSDEWVDFDFFGHQVVAHLDPARPPHGQHNEVDGHDVPVPHFEVGEQATMFLYDPSGNALEFKAFKDPSRLFAK